MESTGDHLKRTALRLDMGRAGVIRAIQDYLDELYPGQARAASLNNGVLAIVTPSASLASELRLAQVEILRRFSSRGVTALRIQIAAI